MKYWPKYLILALTISGAASTPAAFGSVLNTLHFDEIAPTVVDGLTQQGVVFTFALGGVPSQDGIYGASYPLSDQILQDFVLTGPAQDVSDPSRAATLTFTFFQPTHVLNFAVALTTTADDHISLLLYDALGQALAPVSIATTYDHVHCDPGTQTCLSEAEFVYSGDSAISQAMLSFDGTNADAFALDNLEYELPEPSSFSMLLTGAVLLMALPVIRRRALVYRQGQS